VVGTVRFGFVFKKHKCPDNILPKCRRYFFSFSEVIYVLVYRVKYFVSYCLFVFLRSIAFESLFERNTKTFETSWYVYSPSTSCRRYNWHCYRCMSVTSVPSSLVILFLVSERLEITFCSFSLFFFLEVSFEGVFSDFQYVSPDQSNLEVHINMN
jgi:hypothetical protein